MSVTRNGDLAFMDHGNGLGSTVTFADRGGKKKEQTSTTAKAVEPEGSSGVAYWGTNNDYPQLILKAVENSGSAGAGLGLRKAAHYGNGQIFFKEVVEDNKKSFQLIGSDGLPSDWKAFKKRSLWKKFLKEHIADLETFYISFPEYITSADGNKITKVKRQQAAFCRFELMDKTGEIKNVHISTKWDEQPDLKGDWVTPIPHIDPSLSAEEVKEYCKQKKIRKFIRPVMMPLMGESYYPKAHWHSVYKNGWLDVAASVPELKKHVFENQTVILYHIEITIDYFYHKYGREKWDGFTAKEQDEKRNELLDEMDKRLSGSENTHKSIMTIRYKDEAGNYVDGVTITPVDNKYKDGAYLPEASAANSEILFALGVDPSLIGAGIPGGKLGAGSGSDKREAYTILCALMKTPRETSLEVWDFIRDYNGWDEDLQAGFENTVLTTLDKNPTGSENTAAT